MKAIVAALVLVLTACSGDDDGAGAADASTPAVPDAAVPFGMISGDCMVLDSELTEAQPSLFTSAFAFERIFEDGDSDRVSSGTNTLLGTENAGGSSIYSEAFVFELLNRCEGAQLLATENQIDYMPDGDKTDFSTSIDGLTIGVSVARAVRFPFDTPYSVDDATTLLEDKLSGILESSANVVPDQAWEKQILGVMAYGPGHASSLQTALPAIDSAIRADTIVWIIVTDGDDGFIYCDGPCS